MKQEKNKVNDKQERFTRHLLQLCVLPLFLAMVGSGCKQDAKVAADINPVGTYTLASVDGNRVPCTLTHEGHTMTIQSGTVEGDAFTMNNEGMIFVYRK